MMSTRELSGEPGQAPLAPDPLGSRMLGHIDVHDSEPVMRDEDDRVQRPQRDRLHREQVHGPYALRLILEEGVLGL